jgi:hypothetical protein
MTSLAFALGVVPLMLASGASAETQHAIGTGVFGGMVTATLLAVFFVPVFFVFVLGFQARLPRRAARPGRSRTRTEPCTTSTPRWPCCWAAALTPPLERPAPPIPPCMPMAPTPPATPPIWAGDRCSATRVCKP